MSALPPIVPTKKEEVPPGIVPASQPVVEVTEEERRQQEAQEYLDSLRPNEKMTAERIEEIRQQALAAIPRANGIPIPESNEVTEEQLRNNPSNYQPAIENTFKAMSSATFAPTVSVNPSVVEEAAKPAVAAPVADTDERQQWVCVQGDGIRTVTDGVKHPVFGSDAHMLDQLVKCPQCGSISVRKVMPGEDPDRYRDANPAPKDLDYLRLHRDG